MNNRRLTAIVVGGGIGGLATAAALARTGWDVTVLERQPKLRTDGSGIYIWGNGMRVLRAIGAEAHVRKQAFFGSHFEQRDKDNQVIECMALPPESTLAVMRKDLHAALESAGREAGVRYQLGSKVVAANAYGEVFLASDQSMRADLVVGADGLWSRVRQTLGLELSYYEEMVEGALRTTVARLSEDTSPDDNRKYIENWNGPYRFLITPCNEKVTYLAMTGPFTDKRASNADVDIGRWSELFPSWSHLINRIGSAPVTWRRYAMIKCKKWSAGRAAILGDSAHAQLPNLGQGGGMAMQNGLALAHFLKGIDSPKDIPDALEGWEKSERPIVEHCQNWARLYGEVANLPDDIRTLFIKNGFSHPWVQGEIFKAARHHPTGAD